MHASPAAFISSIIFFFGSSFVLTNELHLTNGDASGRLHHNNDYSEFLFIGTSLLQYWIITQPGDQKGLVLASEGGAQKVNSLRLYFDNPSTTPVHEMCAMEPRSMYCASTFQIAFPNAINIARANTFVHEWMRWMNNTKGMFPRLAKLPYIKYCVVALGRNDAETIGPQELLEHFQEFFRNAHAIYPSCKFLLSSITPRPNPTDLVKQAKWNHNITATNALLEAYYSDRDKFPDIHYVDMYSVFIDEKGEIIERYFNNQHHFTALGYSAIEYALKREIVRYFS